jgi:PAS domain S-box-containing protein
MGFPPETLSAPAAPAGELRWALLFEQSPLSIQVFAPDGRTLRFNPAWENLFGLSHEEAYAFNVLEAPDLIRSGAIHEIRKAFQGEVVFVPPVPFPVRGKPKEIRWIGGTLYPVITPDGVLLEVVVIHHDITELKEAEETMRRLNEILEERVATRTAELSASEENLRVALDAERQINLLKTSFVGMVSHEFRTPLGIISTATELLSRYDGKLTPLQRSRYTGSIMTAVKRMTGMMEHILLLARIDSGNVALARRPLDLTRWLPATLAEINNSRSSQDAGPDHAPADSRPLDEQDPGSPLEHEIRFEIDPSEALRHASLDESLLHHIVGNLFSNACKYSPPGSPIDITLRHQAPHLVLGIRNQGPGIPEDEQVHLFEGFYRGSNVGSLPGTGLGLAITHRCVELLGGGIGVHSSAAAGTVFTVTLPLSP